MKYLIKTISCISLSLLAFSSIAQSIDQKIKQVEDNLIDNLQVKGKPIVTYTLAERMKFYKAPTVSIAIINNGKIEWTRAYGAAGQNNELAANRETLFQIASYSKGISNVLAMLLVQAGVLKLDEPINTYLKSWKFPESELNKDNPLTVRDLISGRSGISAEGFYGAFKGDPVPTLLQLLNGEKPASNSPIRSIRKPRGPAIESGGAYLVLQQLIEDATGKSFDMVLKERLTGPLGMNHTSGQQPVSQNVANGYQRDGRMVKGGWIVYPQLASSGLWSTASDLATFIIERQKAVKGQSKILSQNTMLQMADPNFWKPGNVPAALPDNQMLDGRTSSNLGYQTYMEGSVKSGRGIVIIVNSNNGVDLIREILNGIDKIYGWNEHKPTFMVQLTPEQLKAFEGTYRMTQDDKSYIQITVKDNHLLVMHFPDKAAFNIYPKSDLSFFSDMPGLGAQFFEDNGGNIIKFIAFGRDEWVKVQE
ncbi:MAG: beta-lactamase family protein [Bacteroidetes bacterium]|nr:beta-lactamase family protein [Bacteroidota bacterium]